MRVESKLAVGAAATSVGFPASRVEASEYATKSDELVVTLSMHRNFLQSEQRCQSQFTHTISYGETNEGRKERRSYNGGKRTIRKSRFKISTKHEELFYIAPVTDPCNRLTGGKLCTNSPPDARLPQLASGSGQNQKKIR
eukprot:305808-Pyramimonas_sp.AAC.1